MKRHQFIRSLLAAGLGLALSACVSTQNQAGSDSQTVAADSQTAVKGSGKTVFLAGATGVLGQPLSRILVERGYTVYGTTRSPEKAAYLKAIGVKPVIVNAYDAQALADAVSDANPDVVINQLSDLPSGLKDEEMEEGLKRDNRMRVEGTRNLIQAAEKAGVRTYVAQSIALAYAPGPQPMTEDSPLIPINDPTYGEMSAATQSLEKQVQAGNFNGVILRYGWLYGPRTGFDAPAEGYAGLHVDAAALAAAEAVESTQGGVYNVAEQSPLLDTRRFRQQYPEWRDDFQLQH